MWFKTRVGFVRLTEAWEILAFKNTKENSWSIYARAKIAPEISAKGFLGTRHTNMINPTASLVYFADAPGVGEAIAKCMAVIEEALRTNSNFCDLSQFGDSQAWHKGWQQIQWPDQQSQTPT